LPREWLFLTCSGAIAQLRPARGPAAIVAPLRLLARCCYAALAEKERNLIGERTRAALARKKAQGALLGQPDQSAHRYRQGRHEPPRLTAPIADR
jgi:hypothetical protein